MMAAGDTFRAAAIEQLKIWGDRTGATVIAGDKDRIPQHSPLMLCRKRKKLALICC